MNGYRQQWIDISKGMLIVLVVWGHLIEQVATAAPLSKAIYAAIYLFHMPAFAMLSGMLSKAELTRASLLTIAKRLLLPLVVFQAAYWPALAVFAPYKIGDLLTPLWILWWLASLAAWRVMLPIFLRLPWPLLIAFAIALAAGFVDSVDRTLSLSRTLFFFPAFLVGHLYGRQIAECIRGRKALCTIGFIALTGATALAATNGASVASLYGSLPYSAQPTALIAPLADRALAITAGIMAAIVFFGLVPGKAGWLRRLGRRTLTVFLSHGFVVLLFWALVPKHAVSYEIGFLAVTAVLAVLISLGLSHLHPASGFGFKPVLAAPVTDAPNPADRPSCPATAPARRHR